MSSHGSEGLKLIFFLFLPLDSDVSLDDVHEGVDEFLRILVVVLIVDGSQHEGSED
jgi:hypothetical protein